MWNKCCRSGMVFYLKTQFWGSTAVLQHPPPCRPPVQLHGSTSTPTTVSLTEASTLHTQHHQVRKCAYSIRPVQLSHMSHWKIILDLGSSRTGQGSLPSALKRNVIKCCELPQYYTYILSSLFPVSDTGFQNSSAFLVKSFLFI